MIVQTLEFRSIAQGIDVPVLEKIACCVVGGGNEVVVSIMAHSWIFEAFAPLRLFTKSVNMIVRPIRQTLL